MFLIGLKIDASFVLTYQPVVLRGQIEAFESCLIILIYYYSVEESAKWATKHDISKFWTDSMVPFVILPALSHIL